LIDAIDIMEGNGPNSGDKRHVGLTFASRDIFSQDWYVAELMGMTPKNIPMLSRAQELGLIYIENIVVEGYDAPHLSPALKLPDTAEKLSLKDIFILRMPYEAVYNLLVKKGHSVDLDKCIGCGKCADICPSEIIEIVSGKAKIINKRNCIYCFCCQEICPEHAVGIEKIHKY